MHFAVRLFRFYSCCQLAICYRIAWLKLLRLTDNALVPPPVWVPSASNPWHQLELAAPAPVGYVSIVVVRTAAAVYALPRAAAAVCALPRAAADCQFVGRELSCVGCGVLAKQNIAM